uniref:Lambda repressor-like, DNA-binding protein n=1 Tax=Hydrogenovibrio crunogenus (strain DSM 25203 / XCL-2) TaxID=317025 RepID=Q31HW1_HYDCU
MDISQIRLKNLETLIEENGSAASIAEKIGSEPSVISVIRSEKHPTKNMGKNIARRIENAFGLPDGWMDKYHSTESPLDPSGTVQSPAAEYLVSQDLFALSSQSKKQLIEEVINAIQNNAITDEQAEAIRNLLRSIKPKEHDNRFKKS